MLTGDFTGWGFAGMFLVTGLEEVLCMGLHVKPCNQGATSGFACGAWEQMEKFLRVAKGIAQFPLIV